MALDQSALLEVLEALKGGDVEERIRQAATMIYQALIEAELSSVIGAAPHERTSDRVAQRNGHRPKTLTTTAGDLELRIPKLRTGSFFPSLLERRRRVDQSLFAVIMEASARQRCMAPRPARSTTWSRPSAPTPGSPSPR
jgi:putative transposase